MNNKVYFKNRTVHKLQMVKKIPKQLKGYWMVEHNGQYIGYAAIK
jgi:hypothetical protein